LPTPAGTNTRIASDIHGLERVAPPRVSVTVIDAKSIPGRWSRNFALLRAAFRADYLVIHFLLPEVRFFATLLFLIPFHRCRIVTLDFFIGNPKPWLKPFVSWSINRVSRLLVYFRNYAIFEKPYGIAPGKFHYIPFKINAFELIRDTPPTDESYIFSGGRSRRDFATFFAAVEPLGYPVKILTGNQADLTPHGSTLEGLRVPPNVEILTGDSSPAYFVRLLAASRFVVIPIVRDSTTQAGIGVYLQAMAAHKCVIISSGLGVSDVLSGEEALIVPAGDVHALREAIQKAWSDPALRQRYADNARSYAFPLGNEDTLRKTILHSLPS
jgi:glycosyltransferase involved in cell wall biosynthesis